MLATYSSTSTSSTLPLPPTLFLLLFLLMLMKLSLFFTLPFLAVPSVLFPLLLVSGRDFWLAVLLMLLTFSLLAKSGSASSGDVGRRKLSDRRVRLVSLLRLRLCVDVVVDSASSARWGKAVISSFLFSLSDCDSPVIVPFVRNARLIRFLSCRAGLPLGVGDVTLLSLTCWSSGVGLATCDRDVAAASHEPVGERVCGGAFGGVRNANSR